MLQSFAEHAAIAIANARLFSDLDEALERQQAMTDVLDAVNTAARAGQIVHIRNWDDVSDDVYPDAASRRAGRKSALVVPMVRNEAVVGVFAFSRVEPGGFTDSEIGLLKTFANQAAIAVDNARLLHDIETRNTDLAESLELQTAMSEVLRLISANPGDLGAVFRGIVHQAARMCDADAAAAHRLVGDESEFVAITRDSEQHLVGTRIPRTIALDSREPVFIDDAVLDSTFTGRSLLAEPLVHGDAPFGLLVILRLDVRPFDQRHGHTSSKRSPSRRRSRSPTPDCSTTSMRC